MKACHVLSIAVLLILQAQTAYAGFFGTFCTEDPCELPEPSSLALFALGGSVALAVYLKNRRRNK